MTRARPAASVRSASTSVCRLEHARPAAPPAARCVQAAPACPVPGRIKAGDRKPRILRPSAAVTCSASYPGTLIASTTPDASAESTFSAALRSDAEGTSARAIGRAENRSPGNGNQKQPDHRMNTVDVKPCPSPVFKNSTVSFNFIAFLRRLRDPLPSKSRTAAKRNASRCHCKCHYLETLILPKVTAARDCHL